MIETRSSRHPEGMVSALLQQLAAPLGGAVRQIRSRAHHLVHWHGRPLRHALPSGLGVRVACASDWYMYNEVFVNEEYDRPIQALLDAPVREPWVVDLGANVGYFSLRFADAWLRARGERAPFHLISVEGSPRTFVQLKENLAQPALGAACQSHFGLVGRKSGSAYISTSTHTAVNSMFGRESLSRARVEFLDMEGLVPPDARVSLLKCDIEGAEEVFLESYPDLLQRVDVAVFEFHHRLCDVARCREMVERAGLVYRIPLRECEEYSVEMFTRNTPE